MVLMQISFIIVNYNTKDLLRDCLKSVFEQTKNVLFEVFVVDNHSTDGFAEMLQLEFPQVLLIAGQQNIGFGRANNLGMNAAKGKYYFF